MLPYSRTNDEGEGVLMSYYRNCEPRKDDFFSALTDYLYNLKPETEDQKYAYQVLSSLKLDGMGQYSTLQWDPPQKALLVLPSTGGTTSIIAFMWVYLTGAEEVTVKVGRGDTEFHEFLEHLNDDRVLVLENRKDLVPAVIYEHDLVVVYGSDFTCQEVRRHASVDARVVLYPSKFSISVVDLPIDEAGVRGMVKDIFTYDGLGCLNTSVVYVKHPNQFLESFIPAYREEFDKRAEENTQYSAVAGGFRLDLMFSPLWDVSTYEMPGVLVRPCFEETDRELESLPQGFGTIHVVPYEKLDQIHEDLGTLRHKVTSCTTNAFHLLDRLYKVTGASRVTHLGEAQHPDTFSWRHDGTDSFLSLLKLVGVEGRKTLEGEIK